MARAELEARSFHVLGAWLSPSHDEYVTQKAYDSGTIPLSSKFRVRAAQLATEDDDLVEVGTWESQEDGFVDFPQVVLSLTKSLQFEKSSVEVFYVSGTDHAAKC